MEISDQIRPIELKSKKTNNAAKLAAASQRAEPKPYQPIGMEIFSQKRPSINEQHNKFKDRFGPEEIVLGKTSTKRATNVTNLKDSAKLNKIFERKDGVQIVRGRGNRGTPADGTRPTSSA